LGRQQAIIETSTALEAARLQSNLIAQENLLYVETEKQRSLERQLEIQQGIANVIQTQVGLANALKQALTDAGIIEEKKESSGGSKSKSKSKSKKKKASGGPVLMDDIVLVGELGPEIFVPPHDGYILNNATTERLMSAVGMISPRIDSTVRQRQVGGGVWGGRSYLVGEGSGVEGFAQWAPSGGNPGHVAQQIKVVQSTVHYHVHEQQRSGEARLERVVYETIQVAMNS
jgi:hypothetical protein